MAKKNEAAPVDTTASATVVGDVPEKGELIQPSMDGAVAASSAGDGDIESVGSPAKVMRIGSMVKQLLDEVKSAPLDDASRARLADIYERSIVELGGALSPDLQTELKSLAHPFDKKHPPSDAELRIAQAQLVGWLEGLFHGIQATLFAQQLAARQQLEQMRGEIPQRTGSSSPEQDGRPGTYL
jgi:Protein of unknown function (DUF2587)